MQLQLSLKIADRLHQDLLVRGEPLEAQEAARLLLATCSSPQLSLDVLKALVRDDRRFCWAGPDEDRIILTSWMASDPHIMDVPFVALDLETTGAKAGVGKITEVGAVRIEGLRAVGQFETLVNPQRPIPAMITRITGITQSMVADAPRIDEIIPSLLDFLDGAIVVAHNAPFDVGFLNYELQRLRSRRLGDGAIDTLPLSRALLPGLVNYRLKTVAEALDAPVAACHRAMADAQAVSHVFIRLSEVLRDSGMERLNDLYAHGRPSPPSHLEKLALTRDLPRGPGTYVFFDGDDRVLRVGGSDGLADEVRSFFMPGAHRDRGLRTAVRLVERIDYQETMTPLEAMAAEHQLLLEHRPPHSQYWTSPESYLYIKASCKSHGLDLATTRCEPRRLRQSLQKYPAAQDDLVIGPFRRRSPVKAAVAVLKQCYPIRHCPRRAGSRPCERSSAGSCLSPCIPSGNALAEHDRLVTDIVMWLAGQATGDDFDPARHVEQAARELSLQGLDGPARCLDEGLDHLKTVRRSYDALAKASRLCFVCLWPRDPDGGRPMVRADLVWRGLRVAGTSLGRDAFNIQVAGLLADLHPASESFSACESNPLVAVRQDQLDAVLALGRWFQQDTQPGKRIIPLIVDTSESLEKSKADVMKESAALLAERHAACL